MTHRQVVLFVQNFHRRTGSQTLRQARWNGDRRQQAFAVEIEELAPVSRPRRASAAGGRDLLPAILHIREWTHVDLEFARIRSSDRRAICRPATPRRPKSIPAAAINGSRRVRRILQGIVNRSDRVRGCCLDTRNARTVLPSGVVDVGNWLVVLTVRRSAVARAISRLPIQVRLPAAARGCPDDAFAVWRPDRAQVLRGVAVQRASASAG